jgi:hypothetical protein
VPPDITPPVGNELYIYSLVIEGNNYDPFSDTYNALIVDGNTFNVGGGSLLSANNGGDNGIALGLDYAAAIPDQVGNGYNYWGIQEDGFTNNYFFLFVTTEPHTIAVNVTLGGVTSSKTVTGGLVTYGHRCVTITTADPNSDYINTWNANIPNEVGGTGTFFRVEVGGVILSNTVSLNSSFNSQWNTTNNLLSLNVTYTDNGNGTITLNYTYPSSPILLTSVQGPIVGLNNFINC